jgi:hypothetical protein
MTIMGFNFTKFSGERKEVPGGQVNIKNNLTVKDLVEEKNRVMEGDMKTLKVSFEFSSTYEPDMGNISINANILTLEDKETGENILKEWTDNQKLPDDYMRKTLNFMLKRCNVKAINLSEDLNLPSPVPLPKIDPPKTED